MNMKDGIHPKYYTPKQAGYAKAYLEKQDEIKIRMPKGEKDKVKAHALAKGESVNAFINRAINETMKIDNERKE